MRGQLLVQQVGHMQVHQRVAAQLLQHGLDLRLLCLELAARTGHPDKAAGHGRGGQGGGFHHAGADDGEDTHTVNL